MKKYSFFEMYLYPTKDDQHIVSPNAYYNSLCQHSVRIEMIRKQTSPFSITLVTINYFAFLDSAIESTLENKMVFLRDVNS